MRAKGKITGTRTNEANQTAECAFRVTVKDPQRPDVDGRKSPARSANGKKSGRVSFLPNHKIGVCRSIPSRRDAPAPNLLPSSIEKLGLQVLRLVGTTLRTQLNFWSGLRVSNLN